MKMTVSGDKRGFLVLAAALVLAGCIFAGFAIDLGRAYLVKGELQNAADATALAGAGVIYQGTALQWSEAKAEAERFIGKNRADGKALTTCAVEWGFWNISTATAEPFASAAAPTGTCYDSGAPCSDDYPDCGANDGCRQFKFPYIKVTVGKTAGQNGGPVENDGPVPTLFARVIGWNGFQPRASAIALSGSPGSVPPGALFPFVITQPCKNQFFELAAGRRLDMPLGAKVAGQWSDLSAESPIKTNDVRGYIDYLAGIGNKESPAVWVNKTLHIEPVANTSPYTAARNLIEAGKGRVLMPVVSDAASGNSMVVVKGFIAVELLESDPINNILRGRLLAEYDLPPGATPGGESTNAVIHPKLVR